MFSDSPFKISSKAALVKGSKALHERLYSVRESGETPDQNTLAQTAEVSTSAPSTKQLANELAEFLDKEVGQARPVDTFTKEVNLFCAGKKHQTETIKQVHQALLTIPPTSVEAERVFSAGGLYITKLRSQLSDASIDMLIFLKFYFSRKQRMSM